MVSVFLLAALASQTGGWQLGSLSIKGLDTFTADAVAGATGLRKGARAGKAEFDAGCQKLVASGLFQFCNYKFMPVSESSVSLELNVQQTPADHATRITVPGVDDEAVWQWLEGNEPLIRRTMPGSEEATRFYIDAIHRALRSMGNTTEVTSAIESDLSNGRITVVFRPANLPSVVDVHFEGNVLFTEKRLRDVLMTVASQSAFTEFDFRKLLDLNIRPLYEEAGRLGVQFSRIAAAKAEGGVVVTTSIIEGPVYILKRAKLSGDAVDAAQLERAAQLPVGGIANWRKVEDGLAAAAETLRDQGYLTARFEANRKLDDAAGHAQVDVVFHRGEQFQFGGLRIEGLPADLEARVRELWRLEAGAPMNQGYVNVFLRSAFQVVGKDFRNVAKEVGVRPGTRMVDVTAKFTQ